MAKPKIFRLSLIVVALGVLVALSPVVAAAQCATCPTTPVVAYQPTTVAAAPVAYSGWYPGKLFDYWAANRASSRTAWATGAAVPTAAYRPVTAYRPIGVASAVPMTAYSPVTAYRPVTPVAYHTSLMPVRVWRPWLLRPFATETVYRPVTTATSVVSTATACCDPCGGCNTCVGTASYAAPSASPSCCGTGASGYSEGYNYGPATSQPQLGPNESIPSRAGRPTPAESEGGDNGDGAGESEAGDGSDTAGFGAPPLFDPRMQQTPAAESDDRTARTNSSSVRQAVYRERVQPAFAKSNKTKRQSSSKKLTRAEKDSIWTPVSKK